MPHTLAVLQGPDPCVCFVNQPGKNNLASPDGHDPQPSEPVFKTGFFYLPNPNTDSKPSGTRISLLQNRCNFCFALIVLESPITLISAYYKLVEKFRVVSLAWQHLRPQVGSVEVYQPQIVQVSEGESPKTPSDSAKEWGDAQTIISGTYVRMWHPNPLSPWQPSLARESDSPEIW